MYRSFRVCEKRGSSFSGLTRRVGRVNFSLARFAASCPSAGRGQALAQNATDRLDAAGRTSRLSLRFDLPESAYSAYARHRDIVEPMQQLIGEKVFHYHHKMMLKEPQVGGAWEWHQDFGYWYDN